MLFPILSASEARSHADYNDGMSAPVAFGCSRIVYTSRPRMGHFPPPCPPLALGVRAESGRLFRRSGMQHNHLIIGLILEVFTRASYRKIGRQIGAAALTGGRESAQSPRRLLRSRAGSGSARAHRRAGKAVSSLVLPSTIAALRSRPRRLVRKIAVPRKRWRNTSSDRPSISIGIERLQVRVVWKSRRPRLRVPRADILANVATEQPVADAGPQFLRDRRTQFDGEVANAAASVEPAWTCKSLRRAGVQTSGAGTAMAGYMRGVGLKFNIDKKAPMKKKLP